MERTVGEHFLDYLAGLAHNFTLISSVDIKTLNIRIKTIDFISVTIETKRRHDTCTFICVLKANW